MRCNGTRLLTGDKRQQHFVHNPGSANLFETCYPGSSRGVSVEPVLLFPLQTCVAESCCLRSGAKTADESLEREVTVYRWVIARWWPDPTAAGSGKAVAGGGDRG